MDTKTPIHPITGKLMPRSNGRPTGSKNKITLMREQMQAKSAGIVSGIEITPLEAMLDVLRRNYAEYQRIAEAPVGTLVSVKGEDDPAKEHRALLKAAERGVLEAAIAAAPYCHSKLQTIDKATKKNVTVQIVRFGDVPPLKARPTAL